jgi:hypothetical protein
MFLLQLAQEAAADIVIAILILITIPIPTSITTPGIPPPLRTANLLAEVKLQMFMTSSQEMGSATALGKRRNAVRQVGMEDSFCAAGSWTFMIADGCCMS